VLERRDEVLIDRLCFVVTTITVGHLHGCHKDARQVSGVDDGAMDSLLLLSRENTEGNKRGHEC
jgi:hypothetical protein